MNTDNFFQALQGKSCDPPKFCLAHELFLHEGTEMGYISSTPAYQRNNGSQPLEKWLRCVERVIFNGRVPGSLRLLKGPSVAFLLEIESLG